MKHSTTDEGIEIKIDLLELNDIPVVFIETFEYEEECQLRISGLASHWIEIAQKLHSKSKTYIKDIYQMEEERLEVVKIYIDLEDDDGTFGVMCRSIADSEHGVGVKFENFEINDIGSSEIAFL